MDKRLPVNVMIFLFAALTALSGSAYASGHQFVVSTSQAAGDSGADVDAGEVGSAERPMIWVRASEREAILKKIEEHENVADYYRAFRARVEPDLTAYAKEPLRYLARLPFDQTSAEPGTIPPFKLQTDFGGADREEQNELMHVSQVAIDCGVLYFLTREERYARFAADVLHTFVQATAQMPLDTTHYNAGWLYSRDHLREAREIGAQLPILYDFVQPWLVKGNTVFDLGKNDRTAFNFEMAETVFRTYCELALNRGGTGHNWPILEASSLVGNALALSDPAERAHYLQYFLQKDTDRQDALPTIGAFYDKFGGSWPESFGYSQHVSGILTYLFALLDHYDPSLQLMETYPQIARALPEAYYFTYPGGKETILHGDGHRKYHPNIEGYETAYHLARREGSSDRAEAIGPLINHAVNQEGYLRFTLPESRDYAPRMYVEPTRLLWFEPVVTEPAGNYPLPVTDELPFAGITIQRNLSPSGKARDGLMGFVGGGSYVHGHATGMSMELFGKGYVLGSKGGRTKYRTDIHENYYRIFASNNTVIVNGATTSGGGWVRLGHDRVKRKAVEPAIGAAPMSPDHSFTVSSFHDTVGTKAEAYQERTLGIIRTSDSTGYYLDIFRSRSELDEQYHDYIYRNVGDRLQLTDDDGSIEQNPTPERYRASADGKWKQNRRFRHPGWHFFTEVETSAEDAFPTLARFVADRLEAEPVEMWAHLPAISERAYTTATSPPLTEGPRSYRQSGSPTLVIRQKGPAWDKPFAVVYEPINNGRNSVKSVKPLWSEDACQGIVVESNERAGGVTQHILAPTDPGGPVHFAKYNLTFEGTYAVITFARDAAVKSIYLGQGTELRMNGHQLRTADGQPVSAYVTFTDGSTKVKTNQAVYYKLGDSPEQLHQPE